MKQRHKHMDPRKIEAFYDGDLEEEACALVRQHTAQCPACKKILQENTMISASFGDVMTRQTWRVDLTSVDRKVLERIELHSAKGSIFEFLGMTRRTWVPAIAAVSILVFFVAFFNPAPSHSEPSAYVQSLGGDVASVMILETHQSRQTVLWFEEAPYPYSDMGERQGYEGWLYFLKRQQIV